MPSIARCRKIGVRAIVRFRQFVSLTLAISMVSMSVPYSAMATIYEMDDGWITSPTNPGDASDYDVVWREGWGNSPLPEFNLKVPQPDKTKGEPAIVGGYYFVTRPGSTDATISVTNWADCYTGSLTNKDLWKLFIDVPSEVDNPGALYDVWNNPSWPPVTSPPVFNTPYEGPFETWVQYYAKDTTNCASGAFDFGIDVTPPAKVGTLTATPGYGATITPSGWFTQSRVILNWPAGVTYDSLSGTGYFEVFLDGQPWATPDESSTRRTYDLREHYPGYGFTVNTKREMVIEDLPAGQHTLQVRAVDRATNAGPLSEPIAVNVDPDIPQLEITSPEIDGQYMGANPLLSAVASDKAGVQYVRFRVAPESDPTTTGVFFTATDTVAPYNATADLTAPAYLDGSSYVVLADVADLSGRVNTVTKTFRIDKKPSVSIATPSNNTTVSSFAALNVNAGDRAGVTGVDFAIDGSSVDSWSPPSAAPTSTVVTSLQFLTPGAHTFTATVSNNAGGIATETVSFVVDPSLRPSLNSFATGNSDAFNVGLTAKWFSTAFPPFTVMDVDDDLRAAATGLAYQVDRDPMTWVDVNDPSTYYSSSDVETGTTLFDGTIDQRGVYLSDTDAFDGNNQVPGAVSDPIEGIWYTHAALRNPGGQVGPQVHSVYGIDLTDPDTLAAPVAYANATTTTPITAPLGQNRAVLKWDGTQCDDLSGVEYFNVYVDGNRRAKVMFEPDRPIGSVTVENLATGRHAFTVTAVDRAGNESASSPATTVVVDLDAPQVALTYPASNGTVVSHWTTLTADALDAGGIDRVTFRVAASAAPLTTLFSATDTVAPYEAYADMSAPSFTDGDYIVTAEAEDIAGRTVTQQYTVVLDRKPAISIAEPLNGSTVSHLAPLQAQVSDVVGLSSVLYRFDGGAWQTHPITPGDKTAVITALQYLAGFGGHTVEVRATSLSGSVRTTASGFTVNDAYRPRLGSFEPPTIDADVSFSNTGNWFNTPYPNFVAMVDDAVTDPTSVLYLVDRSPTSTIDPSNPNAYYSTSNVQSGDTLATGVIDQLGVYLSDPVRFDGAAQAPGMVNDALEGLWYQHAVVRNSAGQSGSLMHTVYGIDLTKPDVVGGVGAFTSATTATPAPAWMDQTRIVVRWNGVECDDLSGVDYFKVYLDGQVVGGENGKVDFEPARSPMSLTIEDLAQGPHTITVTAVDLAGNESDPSAPVNVGVKSKPTITITSPQSAGATITSPAPLRATARDVSGIDYVDFSIVGTSWAETFTPSVATTTLACATYAPIPTGTYTLVVTAYSVSGPSTTTTRTFNVDDTLPPEVDPDLPSEEDSTTPDVETTFLWFNNAFPTFTAQPSQLPTNPTELLYLVDRSQSSIINPSNPNAYYASFMAEDGTTYFNGLIDQLGVLNSDFSNFDGRIQPATLGAVVDPVEGVWYIHALVRNTDGRSSNTAHVGYGVDITPPPAVGNVALYSSLTTPAAGWLNQSRVIVRWDGVNGDLLSGTEYYNVYIDGVALDSGDAQIGWQVGRPTMSLTIENLTAGRHDITVAAVDRAGNEGPQSAPETIYVDAVAPIAKVVSPRTDGKHLSTPLALTGYAYDSGAIDTAAMTLDGVVVASAAPSADTTFVPLAALMPYGTVAPGSHDVTVTVTDQAGQTTTDHRTFVIDESLPVDIFSFSMSMNNAEPWRYTSTTNPYLPDDSSTFWRQYWGSSAHPQYTLQEPAYEDVSQTSLYYLLDRSPNTVLDVADKADYERSPSSEGSVISGSFDLDGMITANPALAGAGVFGARVSDPAEGVWYWHAMHESADGAVAKHTTYFGVDMTKPATVSAPVGYLSSGDTVPLAGSSSNTRLNLRWANSQYDALSGTAYYRVYMDGECVLPGGDDVLDPVAGGNGVPWFSADESTATVTIEDVAEGRHTFRVSAVDRAGNESALSAPYALTIDLDAPKVAITAPATAGETFGHLAEFSAEASDAAGVDQVNFRVAAASAPGVTLFSSSDTEAPYESAADFSAPAFADGSYILTAEAVDVAGGIATAQRTFNLDKRPTVTVNTPGAGSTVSHLVPIRATVNDAVGLSALEYRVGAGSWIPVPVSVGATQAAVTALQYVVASGAQSVSVRATSQSGSSQTGTAAFTIADSARPALSDFEPTVIDPALSLSNTSEWFNTAYPSFTARVDAAVEDPTEVLYTIDRTPTSTIDASNPNAYNSTPNVEDGETLFSGVIDQLGIYLSDPARFDGAVQAPGLVNDPLEGLWYQHAVVRNAAGDSGALAHTVYGVDLTAPDAVGGVGAYTNATTTTPVPAWMDQTRAVIRWSGDQCDDLSGVDHFKVYLDGAVAVDRVAFESDRSTMAITVEDLTPGAHTVYVTAVDRAGNESVASAPVSIGIKSSPTITITSPPSVGATITSPAPLRATAKDVSGIDHVDFSIVGTSWADTFVPSVPTTTLACSAYSPIPTGSYTLVVTAYSVSGPSTTTTRTFNVDDTLPPEVDPDLPSSEDSSTPDVETEFLWFNNGFPTFTAQPSKTPTNPTELLYLVDRTPTNIVDPMSPNAYYGSFMAEDGMTYFNGLIDQLGVLNSDFPNFDGRIQPATLGAVVDPIEGVWYIHALVRNTDGLSSNVAHVGYGVDITPPPAVEDVALYSSIATPVAGWLNQSRVVVRWDGVNRDLLSGTEYFNVYVDGIAIDSGDAVIGWQVGRATMSLTIEDLTPGKHVITVSAVDRAGNEGAPSAPATVYVDAVAPMARITNPSSDIYRMASPVALFGDVYDSAAIADATMVVDGLTVASVAPSTDTTYQTLAAVLPFGTLAAGSHDVTVTVTDRAGQTSSDHRTFVVDESLPVHILDFTPFTFSTTSGTSETNPYVVDDDQAFWRQLWGNSANPQFTITSPVFEAYSQVSMFYQMDRSPNTVLDPASLEDYEHSMLAKSSDFTGTFDLNGILAADPTLAGPNTFGTRAANAVEGVWYWHALFDSPNSSDNGQMNIQYGVDQTAPDTVGAPQGFLAAGAGAPLTGVSSATRLNLRWPSSEYDRLSGTAYYRVYMDGECVLPGGDNVLDPVAGGNGVPWFNAAEATASATIEDLPEGNHTFRVSAVDRAGNESALSAAYNLVVDQSAPTVEITKPAVDGETVGASASFSAAATDAAGIDHVAFSVAAASAPGVPLYSSSDNAAPYEAEADFSAPAFADGNYILTAQVVDVAGGTASATRPFIIDRKPVVDIATPIAGSTVSHLVPIRASISDEVGLASLDYRYGVGSWVPVPVSAGATTAALTAVQYVMGTGAQTVSVRATSQSGSVRTQTSAFTVTDAARPVLTDFAPVTNDPNVSFSNAATWFNTTYPAFTARTDATVADPTAVLYSIDRTPTSTIDPSNPNAYYSTPNVEDGVTLFNGLIDQFGVYLSDPARFDGALQAPSMVNDPLEGLWYQHSTVRNAAGESGALMHTVYGVDLTKPDQVTGVGAFASATTVTPAPTWMDQTRAVVRWDGNERDDLSGVEYYKVYLDGAVAAARVPFEPGRSPMSVTIEDLTAGPHSIWVTAVDRAGNESTPSVSASVGVKSTPTVTITSPASEEATVPSPAPLRATAYDVSNIDHVTFSIVETAVAQTFTPSVDTSTLACSMYAPLPSGTYTLNVTAVSKSGPSTVVTRRFNVDDTLPPEVPTNPGGGGGGPVVTTTFSWFNTAFPSFIAEPSDQPTDPTELLYLVDRTDVTPIDPANPNAYYASFKPTATTTYVNGVIDQLGVLNSDFGALDGFTQPATIGKISDSLEGYWYIHALFRNALGEGGDITHVSYGVDLTDPPVVNDVELFTSTLQPVTGWLNQSRIVVRWEGINRDLLSGTDYFNVYVDGEALDSGQDKIAWQQGRATMSLTIEDLTQGSHDIQVSAVDRAGNESPLSPAQAVLVDLNAPAVQITSPAAGASVGATPTFSATATDSAGVDRVDFSVALASAPGVPVYTYSDTSEPFEASPDFSTPAFTDGNYILTATAHDGSGRTASAQHPFVLDRSPEIPVMFPSGGAAVSRLVPIRAVIEDEVGLSSVEYRVDGGGWNALSITPGDKTAEVTALRYIAAGGAHTIDLRATSTSSATKTRTEAFTVDTTMRPGSDLTNYATQVDGVNSQSYHATWFNQPVLEFNTQLGSVDDPTEVLYTIDRTPTTYVDPLNPNAYYSSSDVDELNTLLTGTVDVAGVYLNNPAAYSGVLQAPGMVNDPVEGLWYTHALVRNAQGESGPLVHTVYGVDITDPSVVTGVAAYSSLSPLTPVTGWLDQTRATVRWNGSQYDQLSGVDHYNVYLDGELAGERGVPYEHGRTPMALTIEDLTPGRHNVTVTAVDAAGNESAPSASVFIGVRSTPTINIVSPASENVTVSTPATLRAIVSDASGVDHVTISVIGTAVAQTFTPSTVTTTYACSLNAPLSTGTYTMQVTAWSLSGPSTTATRVFNVDSSLPPDIDPGDPGGGGGPVITPSFTWFNTPFPTFSATPSEPASEPIELLYAVDRATGTLIDATQPNMYYSSYRLEDSASHVNGVIDQQGVYMSNPTVFDGALQFPGRVTSPIEGLWYLHAAFRTATGVSGGTTHSGYGVDLTRPSQVDDVEVYSSAMAPSPTTGWLDQSRIVIRWNGAERDALSGTHHYNVYVDGELINEDDVIPYQQGRSVMQLAIEDLTAGKHSVHVTAVDRAGNESLKSTTSYVQLDSDTPGVVITNPTSNGQKLGLSAELSAVATDGVGVHAINFRIDGASVGTATASGMVTSFTGKLKPDWASFSTGTHTLTVYATDHYGHMSSATRTFYLDKTAPSLSLTSAGPSTFYPRKRDGYKDNYIVKFSTGEASTARLTIKNSAGKTIRTVTKSVGSGAQSIYWDGKPSSGDMAAGKYRWTLQLTDAAGNSSRTVSGYATIAFYEVIKTGTNTVRVVLR